MPKIVLKSENSYNKMQFTGFLLLNILDQILKISTIVETLVTVGSTAFLNLGYDPYFRAQVLHHLSPSSIINKYKSKWKNK